MFTLIITLIILFSALLIVLILVQNPKGGGIGGEFGGAGATQMFGVKKTGDLVEQLTWGFSIAIMVLVLASNFTLDNNSAAGTTSINVERAASKPLPATPAPAPIQAPGPANTPAK